MFDQITIAVIRSLDLPQKVSFDLESLKADAAATNAAIIRAKSDPGLWKRLRLDFYKRHGFLP